MIFKNFVLLVLFVVPSVTYADSRNFEIEIIRKNNHDNLITGDLFINDEKIGTVYENYKLRILPGIYPGYLRYVSKKGFVTGPWGQIGHTGDFLLEIGDVEWSNGKKRSNILFHGGNKPSHSTGCVMLGGVPRDKNGIRYIPENHLLAKIRQKFYGDGNPISCPLKKITVIISEILFSPACLWMDGELVYGDEEYCKGIKP